MTLIISPMLYSKDGVLAYELAAEEWNASVQDQSAELTTAVEESQGRIKALFTQLKELEEQREEWWSKADGLLDDAGA